LKNKATLILFFTVFIDLLGFGLVIPILPNLTEKLGATPIMIGAILSVYSLMNFLFMPLLGSLSDRYGRRPIMMISVFMNMISYIVFAYSKSYELLFLSRLIAGVGSANIGTAQAMITDISTNENRAKSMGMIGAAFGLGFIFGPPIGGLVVKFYSLWHLGILAALLCAANLISILFFLKETIKELNIKAPIKIIPINDWKRALKTPIIGELILLLFIYVLAFTMMQGTSSLLWEHKYNQDAGHIGMWFALIGVFSAIVQGVLVGVLVKKFGEKNLMYFGTFSISLGLFLLPLASQLYFVPCNIAAILFICMGSGVMSPSVFASISKYVEGQEQGKMLGISQSISSLARVIGPSLATFLYGTKILGLPFWVASVIMLCCVFVLNNLRNKLA
jgi:MFS transporter, DHA1 family, tetracycline resistance protein